MAFQDKLLIEWFDEKKWQVKRDWTYHAQVQPITVKAGYKTDFATVPRIFQGMLPATGGYTQAAVLHDFLCDHGLELEPQISRFDADGIFRRVMREHAVRFFTRWIMWAAVRTPGIRQKGFERGDWRLLPIGLGPGLVVMAGGLVAVPFMLAFLLLELLMTWADNRRGVLER